MAQLECSICFLLKHNPPPTHEANIDRHHVLPADISVPSLLPEFICTISASGL